MKLLIAVVNKRDSQRLCDALVEKGYRFTEIGSTGGFLREGNLTLLIGIPWRDLDGVLALLREHCRTRNQVVSAVMPMFQGGYAPPVCNETVVPVGGAKVFVVRVEEFLEV